MIGTAQVCSEDSVTPTRPSTGESPKGCARPSSATAFLAPSGALWGPSSPTIFKQSCPSTCQTGTSSHLLPQGGALKFWGGVWQRHKGQNSPPGPKAFKTTPGPSIQMCASRKEQRGDLRTLSQPLPRPLPRQDDSQSHLLPCSSPGCSSLTDGTSCQDTNQDHSRPRHTQGPHGSPHAVSCPEQAAAVLWPVCPQTGMQLQDGPLFCPGKGGLTQSSASTTTLQPPMPPCLLTSCEWPPHSPYPDSSRNQPQGPSSLYQGP